MNSISDNLTIDDFNNYKYVFKLKNEKLSNCTFIYSSNCRYLPDELIKERRTIISKLEPTDILVIFNEYFKFCDDIFYRYYGKKIIVASNKIKNVDKNKYKYVFNMRTLDNNDLKKHICENPTDNILNRCNNYDKRLLMKNFRITPNFFDVIGISKLISYKTEIRVVKALDDIEIKNYNGEYILFILDENVNTYRDEKYTIKFTNCNIGRIFIIYKMSKVYATNVKSGKILITRFSNTIYNDTQEILKKYEYCNASKFYLEDLYCEKFYCENILLYLLSSKDNVSYDLKMKNSSLFGYNNHRKFNNDLTIFIRGLESFGKLNYIYFNCIKFVNADTIVNINTNGRRLDNLDITNFSGMNNVTINVSNNRKANIVYKSCYNDREEIIMTNDRLKEVLNLDIFKGVKININLMSNELEYNIRMYDYKKIYNGKSIVINEHFKDKYIHFNEFNIDELVIKKSGLNITINRSTINKITFISDDCDTLRLFDSSIKSIECNNKILYVSNIVCISSCVYSSNIIVGNKLKSLRIENVSIFNRLRIIINNLIDKNNMKYIFTSCNLEKLELINIFVDIDMDLDLRNIPNVKLFNLITNNKLLVSNNAIIVSCVANE